MFGKKSKAEKIKENSSILSGAAGAAEGARPFAERLLYDEELQQNIRVFLETAKKIYEDISRDDPQKIAGRLWDDDKLRKQIEEAAHAAQEGTKRFRGEKVRSGGGGFGKLVLLGGVVAAIVLINPKTGPEARQTVKNIYQSLTEG